MGGQIFVMFKEELEKILSESVKELVSNDAYLLEHDVHEQAISAKLACYISKRMPFPPSETWHVDVEYNRNGKSPKSLANQGNVKPDIIIHRRSLNNDKGHENNNLLVIELKKNPTTFDQKKDLFKIRAFIEDRPYHFKYGLFIVITTLNSKNPMKFTWLERKF